MIAHYLQGKSHNARAMLNEHQLAGDMASVGPENSGNGSRYSKTARCL